jgi:hypothetical protein
VLVYGNPGFNFNGFAKSYEMYGNPDNDPRGDWRISDLTSAIPGKSGPISITRCSMPRPALPTRPTRIESGSMPAKAA